LTSESKEFDEVYKPAPKEEIKKLESVKDPEIIDKEELEEPESEWQPYINILNEKHAKDVIKVGMKNQYSIPIINSEGESKDVLFERKRLSVKELRQVAAMQKQYSQKPKNADSLYEAEQVASLYYDWAQMMLINASTRKAITQTEFEQQDWGFIKSIVDDCLIKSLHGSSG